MVLNSEQIEKIRVLTREDKSAQEITGILGLPNEYPMITYYRRKFLGKRVKRITKAQEKIILTKADLLEELTNWMKRLAKNYDSVDNYDLDVKNPDITKTNLKNSVARRAEGFINQFCNLLKEIPITPEVKPDVKVGIISKDLHLQMAPILRKLSEQQFRQKESDLI